MIKKFKKSRKKGGFTLVEMLVVLVVVALLMAIIIPNVVGQRDRIEAQGAENIADIIETQAETYRLVEDDDDVTIQKLSDGGYITENQQQEAGDLLNLAPDATIPADITVPSSAGS